MGRKESNQTNQTKFLSYSQSIAHEIQLISGNEQPATAEATEEMKTKQEPVIPKGSSSSAFTNLQNQQLQIITDTGDVQEQVEIESSVSSII